MNSSTNLRFRYQVLIISLLMSFLLSACIGGSHSVRYYVLSPTLDSGIPQEDDNNALRIEITAVDLPYYLDRTQIVSRSGNDRLYFSEENQWGGNLRKDLIRILSVNLSRQLNTPYVTMTPHRSPVLPDYRIKMNIIRFERDVDGKVKLSAKWSMSPGGNPRTEKTHIADLASDARIPDNDYDAVVAAMAALYGELSRNIADEIRKAAPVDDDAQP